MTVKIMKRQQISTLATDMTKENVSLDFRQKIRWNKNLLFRTNKK